MHRHSYSAIVSNEWHSLEFVFGPLDEYPSPSEFHAGRNSYCEGRSLDSTCNVGINTNWPIMSNVRWHILHDPVFMADSQTSLEIAEKGPFPRILATIGACVLSVR